MDATVLILDPLQDGLTQIVDAITVYSNLDAIHLITYQFIENSKN